MIDLVDQIAAIERAVVKRPVGDEARLGVVLRRTFDAPSAAVWAALTEPARVKRWFLPVSGDLRVGGTFQTEGNAGGEILRCDAPHALDLTWGGPTSVVEFRLSDAKGGTALEFTHTVPLSRAGSGAGALFVGPGWDGALLALGLYLAGETSDDPAATNSPEAQAFMSRSFDAWVATIERSGTATAKELAGMSEAMKAQWVTETA